MKIKKKKQHDFQHRQRTCLNPSGRHDVFGLPIRWIPCVRSLVFFGVLWLSSQSTDGYPMRNGPEPIPLNGPASLPAAAIDSSGNLTVAWTQAVEGRPAIHARRWKQNRWESLGASGEGRGVNRTTGDALAPSLVLDSFGNPAVAWQDRVSGNHEILFRRWNGSAWEELEGSGAPGGISKTLIGYSGFPSLAFDSQGIPVIAWEEHWGSRSDIYVRRHSKLGWADIGDHPGLVGFPTKLSNATIPALRLDARGNPAVAWTDTEEGPPQVYFQRWSGSRWQELAGSATRGGVSRSKAVTASVNLQLDARDNPILSWKEATGKASVIQVKRWDGRQWTALGDAPLEVGANPSWPCLALDDRGQPVLAYRVETEVRVKRWSGTGWDLARTSKWRNPPAHTLPEERALAFATGAGKACAVWIEDGPSPALVVACFALDN